MGSSCTKCFRGSTKMGIMLWYHRGDVGNGETSLLGQREQKEEITKYKKNWSG